MTSTSPEIGNVLNGRDPLKALTEDQRITTLGMLIMAVLTLCAGILVYIVMQHQSENFLSRGLQLALQVRVQHLVDTIDNEINKSTTIATRPVLIEQMQRLDRNKTDAAALQLIRRAAQTFLPQGFSAVAFYDRSDNEIAAAGQFVQKPELSITLTGRGHVTLSHVDEGHFVLDVNSDIKAKGIVIGKVSTEARLSNIEMMFDDVREFGKTAEMALCAPLEEDMKCFRTTLTPNEIPRISHTPENMPLPLRYALEGRTGIIVAKDYRNEEVVAAYSPVGELGIGMELKIDTAELYAPIRTRLEIILVLLLALLVFGAALLRWRISPLVRRLVQSEHDARESHDRLLASDTHIRILTEVSPVGIFRTDIKGDCIFVNDRYCEITGITEDQALGEGWSNALYHEDKERVFDAWYDSVRKRQPFSIECRYRQPDGHIVWILAQAASETNKAGEITGYIGSITDITERKQVEAALQASEKRYRTIVETAQEGIWQIDDKNITTFINKKMADMLGYKPEEISGKSIYAFMDEDRMKIAERNIERRRQGITEGYEFEFRRKDGSKVWLLVNANPVVNEYGRYAGSLAMISDITKRKHTQQALLKSEMNFRTLINDVNIGILVHHEGRHLFGNPALLKMLGYTQEQFRNTTMKEIVHPDEYEFVHKRFTARMAGEDVPSNYETVLQTLDGKPIPVELTSTRTIWEGKAVGLVILQDITERQIALEQMRKLSSAVEQTADAIMITDPEGIIEYVNPAFEATTGYTRAEAIGNKPNIIKSDRQKPEFFENLWETILAGESYNDVLINRRKDGSLYYEEKTITPVLDSSGRITHFVSTGKDVTERTQIQERLQYMAQHDALTDLPNRVLLFDRLKHALVGAKRHGRLLAVMFIDLDRFKNINDSLGHEAGDQLLQQLSERLSRCIRDDDTVARFGGDEFVILLEDIASENDISEMASRLLDELILPFEIGDQQLYITASIGVSIYPNDGEDSSTLLKNADVAMYRAKDLGKNIYQFYSADMSVRAFEHLTLESNLRLALKRDEFLLYYQPQIEITSGRIIGVEALLRWQHPEFGMVMPMQFITLLEETGLIIPVGEWVLYEATRQLHEWHDAGWKSLRMAVNLSPRQFTSPTLVQAVAKALDILDSPPSCLEFEITESVLMKNVAATEDTLSRLAQMECRFAIDDFGTGHSSLAYLKRFPIKMLKIDRSFVHDIQQDKEDAMIVKTIVAMAHNLGLEVLAEGVETEEQLAYLYDCGCDNMQGYLFSRPLPPDELEQLLKEKMSRD